MKLESAGSRYCLGKIAFADTGTFSSQVIDQQKKGGTSKVKTD